MTCANRGLLQQMLGDVVQDEADFDGFSEGSQGEEGDDDDQNALGMSLRQVPGTPLAGGPPARSVPTIASPGAAASRRQGQATVMHSVISASSITAPSGAKAKAKAVSITAAMKAPMASMAMPQRARGLGVPPPAASAPGLATIAAPVASVTTGPPQPAATAFVSAPRPGSRGSCGGGAPPSQSLASPAHRQIGAKCFPAGYAGMHAKAKASMPTASQAPSASVKTTMKPAMKPMCGPQAFDMLRRLQEAKKAPEPVNAVSESEIIAEEPEGEELDGGGGDDGGFLMPADSDSEVGGHDEDQAPPPRRGGDKSGLASHGQTNSPAPALVPPRPSEAVAAPAPRSLPGSNQSVSGVSGHESAADYVERLKRGLGMAQVPAVEAEGPDPGTVVGADINIKVGTGDGSAQGPRARSSDSRPTERMSVKDLGPSEGVRARSSDPRAAVVAVRATEAARGSRDEEDDDDDDSDEERPAPGNRGAWKADVRSLVRNFAQEERAGKVDGSRGGGAAGRGAAEAPRRPPRAPGGGAPAASPPAGQPRKAPPTEADPEDPLAGRKPRAVDFTPATVSDYQQRFGGQEYSRMGSLGPDLDDDQLLMKRAVQEKVKQFSKELHRINHQRSVAAPAPKPAPKPEPKPTARSKALEFAKQLPKPKPSAPQSAGVPSHREGKGEIEGTGGGRKDREQKEQEKEAELDRADWEEIRRRERQHFEDVARVDVIKELLSRIAI